MPLNRRDFLKILGTSTGSLLLYATANIDKVLASPSSSGQARATKAILYDVSKCVGCRACQNACKRWNNLPPDSIGYGDIYDNPWNLSSKTWTLIKAGEFETAGGSQLLFCKYQCMHCEHPACVTACIVGALQKTAEGPVVYDDRKCIGCRYCMVACPFGVPTFEWDKPLPWIRKCTFCVDRLSEGLEPACVTACPSGAIKFGEREELIIEAKKRIMTEPLKYINHIYGEKEAGGTSWLYLSPVPFEKLGFPTLSSEPVTVNVERAVGAVLPTLALVAVTMVGVYWLTKRRQKLNQSKADSQEEKGGIPK